MKILGVIPARGGSKGVPDKNIRLLAGLPLIEYTIQASLASKLTKVIVSTDSATIARVSQSAGAEVPFERPRELASDSARSMDVAIHALNKMEDLSGYQFDALMLLQPTAPFRTTGDINNAIDILGKHPEADSVISVVDVLAHHPARMKYLENGRLIDPSFCEAYENQNRQELTPMYIRNGAIYLTRRNAILNRSFKGNICMALVMSHDVSVNIDTLQDFEMAEWMIGKNDPGTNQ